MMWTNIKFDNDKFYEIFKECLIIFKVFAKLILVEAATLYVLLTALLFSLYFLNPDLWDVILTHFIQNKSNIIENVTNIKNVASSPIIEDNKLILSDVKSSISNATEFPTKKLLIIFITFAAIGAIIYYK